MSLWVPSNVQPSYKSGYARSVGESAYPELWRELRFACVPLLGNTGAMVRNVIDGSLGTLHNMSVSDWVTTGRGSALSFAGTDTSSAERIQFASYDYGYSNQSFAAFFHLDSASEAGYLMNYGGVSRKVGIGVGTTNLTDDGNNFIGVYDAQRWIATGHAIGTGWHFAGMAIGTDNDLPRLHADQTNLGTFPGNSIRTGGTLTMDLGGVAGSPYRALDCLIGASYAWSREVTTEELCLLSADPLAPFRRRHHLFFPETGGAGGRISPRIAGIGGMAGVGGLAGRGGGLAG